jgi:hypothetical protein
MALWRGVINICTAGMADATIEKPRTPGYLSSPCWVGNRPAIRMQVVDRPTLPYLAFLSGVFGRELSGCWEGGVPIPAQLAWQM